jgi:hypothetical protein
MSQESRELNGSHWGAYIDSKSNKAVGEKAVRKSNNVGQTGAAPLLTSGMNRCSIFQKRRFNRCV